jgi:hypothetical protein
MNEPRISHVQSVHGYADRGFLFFRVNVTSDAGWESFTLSDEAAKMLVEGIEKARKNPEHNRN